jgi:hypothetical protein
MSDKTRVSMLWPETLKEKVRDRVGSRGLTDFTIEAVEAKLGIHDAHRADSKELSEVKDLAQRLADALALGGDYEDRVSTLRLLEPPAWLQTIGWPEELAAVVKPEDSTPEPVDEPEPDSQHKTERPVEDVELPAIGDPDTILSDPPRGVTTGDLLARIQAKAAEKGVDLSGIDLKAASSIDPPEPAESPEPDSADSAESAVSEIAAEPVAKPIANPNVCPECGTELVNGECWECFS